MRVQRWVGWAALAAALGGCSAPVATALGEEDANRVLAALNRAGVGAEKEHDPSSEGRFVVLVQRDEVSRAVAVLQEEELPPRPSPGVLDAVGKSSLVPSAAVEHAQYVAGLAGDLERTLAGIDGIVTARVHLSAPLRAPLDPAPQKATASVLLKHRGATAPVAPEAVQQLVAGAVAGLQPPDVAVVLVPRPGQAASAGVELTRLGPITVTRGSAGFLRGLVALALLLSVVPTVALLVVWQRGRKALAAALQPEGGGAP
jgi:type III secretion protein J